MSQPTKKDKNRERDCNRICVRYGIPLCPTWETKGCQHLKDMREIRADERQQFAEKMAKVFEGWATENRKYGNEIMYAVANEAQAVANEIRRLATVEENESDEKAEKRPELPDNLVLDESLDSKDLRTIDRKEETA